MEGLLLTSQKAPLEREPPTNMKNPGFFRTGALKITFACVSYLETNSRAEVHL